MKLTLGQKMVIRAIALSIVAGAKGERTRERLLRNNRQVEVQADSSTTTSQSTTENVEVHHADITSTHVLEDEAATPDQDVEGGTTFLDDTAKDLDLWHSIGYTDEDLAKNDRLAKKTATPPAVQGGSEASSRPGSAASSRSGASTRPGTGTSTGTAPSSGRQVPLGNM